MRDSAGCEKPRWGKHILGPYTVATMLSEVKSLQDIGPRQYIAASQCMIRKATHCNCKTAPTVQGYNGVLHKKENKKR